MDRDFNFIHFMSERNKHPRMLLLVLKLQQPTTTGLTHSLDSPY